MFTAQWWGLTPDEWVTRPRWSRAVMVQTKREKGRMEYWLAEDKIA